MKTRKTYIMEIRKVLSDETPIYFEIAGVPPLSLFAIVEISEGGASIVDNCYRTIGEAESAWPKAVARNHTT